MMELKIADHTYYTEFLCLCLVQFPGEIILGDSEVFSYEIDTKLFAIVSLSIFASKVHKLVPAAAVKGHGAFCVTEAEQFLLQILE